MSSLLKNKFFLLLLLILLHVGFWIIRKPPVPGSDDYVYFMNAKAVAAGEYGLNESPKNHRLMVFAPVAVLISLFGESPWVISLWTLLCSCITLTALFLFLTKYSSLLHGFASGLLLATNTLQIDYSDSLFPDVIVAMFAFLFLKEIYKARRRNGGHWLHVIAATLFFYSGFLAKEIIVFALLFTIIIFVMDLKNRMNISFWRKFIPVMAAGGALLVGTYYLLTGELNFIYHSVDTRHNEFYVLQSANEIIARFTYAPALMIANNVGYIILFLLALFFVLPQKWSFKNRSRNSVTDFFAKYLLVLLTTYWIMPISFDHLTLIHLDPRMWMLLLVPLYIAGGFAIVQIVEEDNGQYLKVMGVIFLIAAVAALIIVSPQRSAIFFMFMLSAVVVGFLKRKNLVGKVPLVFILLLPVIILALRFTIANSNFFPQ